MQTSERPVHNPYQPPSAEGYAGFGPEASNPRLVLYTTGQVVLATFLGTILGGVIVMALNYRRLGRSEARSTLVWGVIATLLFFGVVAILPENIPSLVVNIAVLFAMQQLCNKMQGELVATRLDQGAVRGSTWTVVGIGLLCGLILLILFFAVAFAVGLASELSAIPAQGGVFG